MQRLWNRRTVLFALLALSLVQASAQKAAPEWPAKGPIDVIIDTDAANEIDDQYAMAMALGFPEKLHIVGFVAAQFGNNGGVKGIEKSYASILETLEKAGMKDRFPVLKGSDPVVYYDAPPRSEGVDFIIAKAREASPEHPLWIVSLGAATDTAAAILIAPEIQKNIVVWWHGRSQWPDKCMNFNATNDIRAVQTIFRKPAPLILFDTGANLTLPMPESEARIASRGELGQYLHGLRNRSKGFQSPTKPMYDMGDIAALVDPTAATSEIAQTPDVHDDYRYDFGKPNGHIVRIMTIDHDRAFQLLEQALDRIATQRKHLVQ